MRRTLSLFARPRLERLEGREVPAAIAYQPYTEYFAAVTQADGRIVAVGQEHLGSFAKSSLVARFNPDGTPDLSFNGGTGRRGIDFGGGFVSGSAVVIQPDGKIVAVGASASDGFAVVRLNPDGTLDVTFDGDGQQLIPVNGVMSQVVAVGLQGDGTIVLAGGATDFTVVRLNGADGSPIGSPTVIDFGRGDTATALAIAGPGPARDEIVVVGSAERVIGDTLVTDFAAVRLNPDGTVAVQRTFDLGNSHDAAGGVAVQPDGKIIIGGRSGSSLAAVRTAGDLSALDPTFNPTGPIPGVAIYDVTNGSETQLWLQPDGKIVLAGWAVNPPNEAANLRLLRLTPAGAPDPSFNPGGPIPGVADYRSGTPLLVNGQVAVVRLDRVIVPLAVGGSSDGRAAVYTPDSAGRYGSPARTPAGLFGSFAGPVRTAVADVNGDRVPDTILVTGPGTPIRVAVVSGTDDATVLVAPFDPFGGDFLGGGFVAAADANRDGRAELVVTPDRGGGPRVSVFSLLADGSVVPRANFFAFTDDPNFRGGARVAVGDVNRDGLPDLAVAAGFGGGPRVAIYNSASLLGGTPARLVNDFFAFPEDAATLRNGAFVALGDVNGDGFADAVFGGGPGGAPRVLVLSGAMIAAGNVTGAYAAPVANFFVAGNQNDRGGVRVATTDADGDGGAEVVAGSGEESPDRVRVYLGGTFAGTGEPATFQDLTPFGGLVSADGVFVG